MGARPISKVTIYLANDCTIEDANNFFSDLKQFLDGKHNHLIRDVEVDLG